MIDPHDFVITKRRKRYKFAWFHNQANCFEADDWLVPSGRPIIMEVGAGTGYFAVELARRHPDQLIVACDVKADRLQAGARRASERGIANVVFLRIDATQLESVFTPGSIAQLWLTFPDPFPKARHAKHRLTHLRLLSLYCRLLQPAGCLIVKTDNRPLFDWSLEQLVAEGWRIGQLSHDLHQSRLPEDYRIMTTYEERYVAKGLPICCVAAAVPTYRSNQPPLPAPAGRPDELTR